MEAQGVFDELPDGELVVPNQAFRFDGKPIYCTQFHPELSMAANRQRYTAYIEGYTQAMAPEEREAEPPGAERQRGLEHRRVGHGQVVGPQLAVSHSANRGCARAGGLNSSSSGTSTRLGRGSVAAR